MLFPAACFLVLAAIVLPASVVSGSSPASVLQLEMTFPLNQKVELEVLRAWDTAHHTRIGGSHAHAVAGVVGFGLQGFSDPGLYLTRVRLGTPPREYNVQIDTGSEISWVTCSSCSDCLQQSDLVELNFYDTAGSSTASVVSCKDPTCSSMVSKTSSNCLLGTSQCASSFQYGDRSGATGYYLSDLLCFDAILWNSTLTNSSASIVFGCSTSLSGILTNSHRAVDGILGFDHQSTSIVS